MKIHLNQIPPHGLHLEGTESADILDLKGDYRPVSSIRYELDAGFSGSSFFATGLLELDVEVACVTCLRRFTWTTHVENFAMQTQLAGAESVDLTPYMREDILLNLPVYPRCDREGDGVCRGIERHEEETLSPASPAWEALDKLTLDERKKNGSSKT